MPADPTPFAAFLFGSGWPLRESDTPSAIGKTMIPSARHVLITGAGGYIGSRLATRLVSDPSFADAQITLCDRDLAAVSDDPRVRRIEGDLTQPALRAALLGEGADVVFHLAGLLGGAAENDPVAARRVNVESTLSLFEALGTTASPPRVVFASSIAVFGPPLPRAVDDDTTPFPTMLYGAQKLMMETALGQMSARGLIDGLALRLPGIVARRDADARLKSAFLNTLFYRFAAGDEIVLPVSPDGATWLLSVEACIDAFVHAAQVDRARLGQRRAFVLPALNVRIGDLVAALATAFPASGATVHYEPDPAIEAQFARQPLLETPFGDALGFRHDGSLGELIRRAMR